MKNGLTIAANVWFEQACYSQERDLWSFHFLDKVIVNPSEFWRLLKNDGIKYVSFDHKQQFGLPKPIDLEEKLKEELVGEKLIEISIKKHSGDLILCFTNDIKIEVYITSSGYETYEFLIDKKRYIGLGSGNLEIIDDI